MSKQQWMAVALSVGLLAGCQGGLAELEIRHGAGDDVLAEDVADALRLFPSAEVMSMGPKGVPTFVRGELGHVADAKALEAGGGALARPALEKLAPVFRLKPDELELIASQQDALALVHLRYQQKKNGLEVVGGDLRLHLTEAGDVYSVSGFARGDVDVSPAPTLSEADGAARALDEVEADFEQAAPPRLVYVLPPTGTLHLAWEVEVEGALGEDPVKERVYIDAHSGELADRHPLIHAAKNRRVHTANNGTSLPGTLVRSETQGSSSDAVINDNFEHLGVVYDCFASLFGRDSINGNGMPLTATVHYGRNYQNAFWDGRQMVYGDGDGRLFANFARSFDVTAHELTHGVTQSEANLVYRSESGALNEAMSDIFAAVCQAFRQNGQVNNDTWRLAEDIYTPSNPNDAMRNMADPVSDGQSKDYYPTRYTGSQDNGGVHINSGIANLAFKLLVTGGTHPRGRTNQSVSGIGIEKAGKIFYRALTQYLGANSNFQAARAATAQAALDLYGAAEQTSVHQAWNAVGAPGTVSAPGGGGSTPSPAPSSRPLTNGVPIDNLSGAQDAELRFTLTVPSGATNLRIATSGGSGDVDLYVKLGAPPTTSSYDHRPFLNGNAESVSVAAPSPGTWHILVRGYRAFSGVSIVGSFAAGSDGSGGGADGATALQSGVVVGNLSGAAGSTRLFKLEVPAGASQVTFQIGNGTGDADLYVRFGSPPTPSAYDFRPYRDGNSEAVQTAAKAGTWYVMVRGYRAYSGLSLVGRAQ